MQFTLPELRARHKLSQEDVAKKLGISRQAYSNWEKNINSLTVAKLKELAKVLDVEPQDIFLG